MSERPRFHLAIPVDDLDAAAHFYGTVLGCPRGRESDRWIDWDLQGHQLVTHVVDRPVDEGSSNPVDGDAVPVPHFGLILDPAGWRALVDRLEAAGTEFVIAPRTRFAGEAGEQSTCFLRDPAGNAIELKAFADDGMVFEH